MKKVPVDPEEVQRYLALRMEFAALRPEVQAQALEAAGLSVSDLARPRGVEHKATKRGAAPRTVAKATKNIERVLKESAAFVKKRGRPRTRPVRVASAVRGRPPAVVNPKFVSFTLAGKALSLVDMEADTYKVSRAAMLRLIIDYYHKTHDLRRPKFNLISEVRSC